MDKELTPTEAILWAYIKKELAIESRLIDYIINQNMRDLVVANNIQDTEEYRIILQDLFSQYQAKDITEKDINNVMSDDILEEIKQEKNYITLEDERAVGISNSDILNYEFRENGQVIFSNISAQTIYKDILEYLVAKGHTSIMDNRYIPIPTMEKWYEILGNSRDKHIRDKYKPFGNHHMIFISIVPATIMRKLTYLFNDLGIILKSFRIYLRENIKMDTIIKRSLSVTSDTPDLVYNPNDESSFDRHELQFQQDLLKYKQAKKITYKTDGTVEEMIWNADSITATSNLKANIVSNNKIRVYKREGTLDRIEFFIIR